MQWEYMTSPDLARATVDPGVCIFTVSVIERHSDHLPMGCDMINSQAVAVMAAEREPAVVFPPFYFGQINEARCFPGTIVIRPTLMMELIQSMLDEIGRSGFKKITLVSGHGGNRNMLPFIIDCQLWEEKPYTVYLHSPRQTPETAAQRAAIVAPKYGGHAGASETAGVLANAPESVHMDRVPADPEPGMGRLKHLTTARTALDWYADHPNHYQGDASVATAEMGRALRELSVQALVETIRAVKADEMAPLLQSEFFARERSMRE
jgi:creatinine amidohydrolase